jgi:multidrug resistance efflux pump
MKTAGFARFPFRWRLHLIPLLVWLAAVVCVIVLFERRAQRFEVLGIAQGQLHQIAATCPARIRSVSVQLFDKVRKGQTLAVVNTVLEDERPRAVLQAQVNTVVAEVERLTAQLVPTQDTLFAEKADRQSTHVSDARRFSVDVENARLEVLRLEAMVETDKIKLQDLAVDVNITGDLVKKQAVAPYELQKTKVQYEALAKKIEENQHLLDQANAALKQAIQQQSEYSQQQPYNPSVEGALDVIRKGIKVQEDRMNELLAEMDALDARQKLELKAPFDGVVSQVLRRPTDVVLAGEPILTITDANVIDIIAYAGEEQMSDIQKGTLVDLIRHVTPTRVQIERSDVTFVGPAVEQMPARLWQNPNVPEWGRPFLIKAPAAMKLVLGETVGIRRLKTPGI